MTDRPEIQPALSRDEWLPSTESGMDPHLNVAGVQRWSAADFSYGYEYSMERPHAIAAICLHEQPFGFTPADLADMEEAISAQSQVCGEFCTGSCEHDATAARLRLVAAKIAALLPPTS